MSTVKFNIETTPSKIAEILLSTKRDYCVYFHVNRRTGKIFYVGKSKKNSRSPYSTDGRSFEWFQKAMEAGTDLDVLFISDLNEIEALEIKKQAISIFSKDHELVNVADGGIFYVTVKRILENADILRPLLENLKD